jgi:four helix bundle protein
VWQRAQELSLQVVRLVRELPGDRTSSVLGQQVLRSATSIAANIAEGHGRFAAGAYRNHLSIARGSATESLSWFDLLMRSGYIDEEREAELTALCDEVVRMLSAQMISLDRETGANKGFR